MTTVVNPPDDAALNNDAAPPKEPFFDEGLKKQLAIDGGSGVVFSGLTALSATQWPLETAMSVSFAGIVYGLVYRKSPAVAFTGIAAVAASMKWQEAEPALSHIATYYAVGCSLLGSVTSDLTNRLHYKMSGDHFSRKHSPDGTSKGTAYRNGIHAAIAFAGLAYGAYQGVTKTPKSEKELRWEQLTNDFIEAEKNGGPQLNDPLNHREKRQRYYQPRKKYNDARDLFSPGTFDDDGSLYEDENYEQEEYKLEKKYQKGTSSLYNENSRVILEQQPKRITWSEALDIHTQRKTPKPAV